MTMNGDQGSHLGVAADPVQQIMEAVDTRIVMRIEGAMGGLYDYLAERDQFYTTAIADLQSGEVGEAYRRFIVGEAARMGVKPSELVKARSSVETSSDDMADARRAE